MEIRQFVREVWSRARDHDVTFLAAAVAYYSFVSTLPALLLVLVIASTLGGEAFAESLISMTRDFLPESANATVFEALTTGRQRREATLLGTVVLLWGSLKVFRALDLAFSRIHEVSEEESFFETVRDGLTVLVFVGIGLIAMGTVGGFVIAYSGPLFEFMSLIFLVFTLTLVFIPVYYIFPDTKIRIRDAFPGAVFVAVGLTSLNAFFGIYVSFLSGYSIYGIMGAVLLLVTWFYIAGLLLLFGVVVNVTLMRSSNDK